MIMSFCYQDQNTLCIFILIQIFIPLGISKTPIGINYITIELGQSILVVVVYDVIMQNNTL